MAELDRYRKYARALAFEADESETQGLLSLAAQYKEAARVINELTDKLEEAERNSIMEDECR